LEVNEFTDVKRMVIIKWDSKGKNV
jgi:hypothetical protein